MSAIPTMHPRVGEYSTTTGTGTYTLSGAISGYQTFAIVGNGVTCRYVAYGVSPGGVPNGGWETGTGTYTASGTTLARTAILKSSNSNSAVNWAAGTRYIFVCPDGADFPNQTLNTTDTPIHAGLKLGASPYAILSAASIATSDKTFTFPNTTGNLLVSTAVTTESVVSDTTVTVSIGGVVYKLLAIA